jgi:hypothetical protein
MQFNIKIKKKRALKIFWTVMAAAVIFSMVVWTLGPLMG